MILGLMYRQVKRVWRYRQGVDAGLVHRAQGKRGVPLTSEQALLSVAGVEIQSWVEHVRFMRKHLAHFQDAIATALKVHHPGEPAIWGKSANRLAISRLARQSISKRLRERRSRCCISESGSAKMDSNASGGASPRSRQCE